MVVNKQLLALLHWLAGHRAGDVAVHGVDQVRELAVWVEAVVHLVTQSGHVHV